MTEGRDVNVVLNSLAGEGLKASWSCVAPYGRFIEIGKADIMANSSLPMANFAKNVGFMAVDIRHLVLSDPETTARLISKVMDLAQKGVIQCPQPLHIFPVSNTEQAFRYFQSGKNQGRILISLDHSNIVSKRLHYRPEWKFDANASYMVAGGLGGLGRLVIRWMVSRGAKHLILPSRSGASSQAASDIVAELRGKGINVVAPQCDVASIDSVAAMLRDCANSKMAPIKGCINATMDLQDAIFENMTHEQWERTIKSKAPTSWNLHQLLPRSLDFFILFSSLAGIYGSPVQSNYAAGCTFQDALAYHRTAHGEKAISLDIGWMLNSGVIAETERYEKVRRQLGDMGQIQDAELLALLEIYCDPTLPLLSPSKSQLLVGCIMPSDLLAQGKNPVERMKRPLFAAFSQIIGQAARSSREQTTMNFATLYEQATGPEERREVVTHAIARKLAEALTIDPDDVKVEKALSDYGVDSLMAVELRNWIGNDLQANVAVFEIMGGKRIVEIGNLILERSVIGKVSLDEESKDMDETA
ncbi:KR domain-containing protein [Daldinia vernicosa]|uniref:KR domain-containing protein n=1 Tax=Daldinia vernicosa TaxID=114800 RepID=UPI002007E645|nr:KR domain-containing protein [Daldinia vernicosa]KAI0848607.1 KR domain-containing protein [Daldinia vernicosa]